MALGLLVGAVQSYVARPPLVDSCLVAFDGGPSFRVPVAGNAAQQAAGLRYRGGYAGMLFDPAPATLTMRDVRWPLQAVVLAPVGTGQYQVQQAFDMAPGYVGLYALSVPAKGVVLELTTRLSGATGRAVEVFDCRGE